MKSVEGGLYLLIDQSGSMSALVDMPGHGAVRKIDHVERILRSWLAKNRGVTVHCYGFASEVQHKFTLRDPAGDVPLISFHCGGSSLIWDSIDSLLDQISPHSSSSLVCLTDGQDIGSNRTCSDVEEKAKSKGIDLQILLIDEKSDPSVDDFTNTIKTVIDPVAIEARLEDSMDRAKRILGVKTGEKNISVVVIPLVETLPQDILMIQKAVRMAVPYLESLINVRYYPVPTFVVDDYTFQKLRMFEPLPKKPKKTLFQDLQEVVRFLTAVCITVHTGAFDAHVGGAEDYRSYSNLSQEARWRLRMLCEGCCGLGGYFFQLERSQNVPKVEELEVFISELSAQPDFFENSKANLNEVLNILKNIANRHLEKVILDDVYFKQAHGWDEPLLEHWDLGAWERYLSPMDKKKIHKCLNEGLWKKDINSIVVAFEITLNLVFSLLPRLTRTRHPAWPIAQEIHTYGVYLCRSDDQDPRLAEILGRSGFPNWFHLANTGAAVVCLQRIRERFDSLGESTPQVAFELGYEDLVAATVVHEHAHAVIFEGVEPSRSESYGLNEFIDDSSFQPVNETLAEWAELNFFRDNDKVYEVIRMHAESGEFPKWSYRGAIILENEYRRSGDYTCFRTLVDWIGKDVHKAFNLLISFRELSPQRFNQ